MATPNLKDDTENLNPLSSKGVLTFGSFVAIFIGTMLFNAFAYLMVKGQLIAARGAMDVEKSLILYGVWFAFSLMGFASITNAFIKRWAHILDQRELGSFWKSIIRLSLLSPALGVPITLVTIVFFPKSPVQDAHAGAPPLALKASLLLSLVIGVATTLFLPESYFGLERAHFRKSTSGIVELLTPNGENPIPSDTAIRPLFAVASPGTRYVAWLMGDFLRTRALSRAIQISAEKVCDQKLGFMDVEVQDCFFYRLRQMSKDAPFVSPYFALFYETDYRKLQSENLRDQLQQTMEELKREGDVDSAAEWRADQVATQSAMSGFANALLMLSNQLELVEAGPLFIDRKELTKPVYLLRAFGSPELPFIEFGQDAQRYSLIKKLLPVFEFQFSSIETQARKSASGLAGGGVILDATLHDTRNRIEAIKRDPLGIAHR